VPAILLRIERLSLLTISTGVGCSGAGGGAATRPAHSDIGTDRRRVDCLVTEETMLRDPEPQQIEPLADRRFQKVGISAFAALPLCGDGRIAGFISGSHIMRRRNESNRGQAQDRARPAARRGRTSRFKAEAARRDSDG
jgi:hypothetical protein